MGLFNGTDEKKRAEQGATESAGAAAMGAAANDEGFLDNDAGQGFEGMDQSTLATPYLQLTQTNSDIVESGQGEPGHFFNSVTHEDYGTALKIIFVKFAMAWVERDEAGKSIARYEIGGIPITGDNYKGMKNPASGNKVVETWFYQVLLPDHPEAGFMIFSSTPGNMRYLKGLNTQMRTMRLPSGKMAPLYAGVWEISINPDVSKAGKKYFSFKGGIRFAGFIPQVLYQDVVLPIRNAGFMLPAPSDVDKDAVSGEYEEGQGKY